MPTKRKNNGAAVRTRFPKWMHKTTVPNNTNQSEKIYINIYVNVNDVELSLSRVSTIVQ